MTTILNSIKTNITPILRSSLKLTSNSINQSNNNFILPCKKIVIQFSEEWNSNKGLKEFISNPKYLINLANNYPSVEIVLERKEFKHPHVIGIYCLFYYPLFSSSLLSSYFPSIRY